MKLELAQITADQRAQPRIAILPESIEEFADDMRAGEKFPPLIVFREGEKYWLADGFHRYYALQSLGEKSFDCHVREGTLRDAILFSCGANTAHGVRRKKEDKRRAIAKMVEDSEWAQWSDETIAKHCVVSRDLVRRMRKEVAAFIPALKAGMERKFIHPKTGTESVMKLPTKPPEKPTDGQLVVKWLREIERLIDRMPENPDEAAEAIPAVEWGLLPVSKLEWMAGWMNNFAVKAREILETQ